VKSVNDATEYVGGSPDRDGRGYDLDDPRDEGHSGPHAGIPGGKKRSVASSEVKRSKQRLPPPPTGAVGKWSGGDGRPTLTRQGAFWNIEDSQVLPPVDIDSQDE